MCFNWVSMSIKRSLEVKLCRLFLLLLSSNCLSLSSCSCLCGHANKAFWICMVPSMKHFTMETLPV